MIIGIGGVNIDFKYELETNKLNSSNQATFTQSYGGVMRNVLENLGRLNVNVSLVSFVGKDILGDAVLEYSKEYMDISLVKRVEEPTGTYAAFSYDDDLLIGASSISLKFSAEYLKKIETHLIKAEMLVFDYNLDKESISYLISLGNKYNIKTVLIGVSDPKMKNVPEDLNGLYLAIHNLGEVRTYFKSKLDGLSLNKMMKEKGVKNSIITNGKKNVFYNKYEIKVKENPNFIDPTGLGDSFSAGVIYGDTKGYSLEYACVIGMTNSYYTGETKLTVRDNLTEEKLLKEVELYYD